MKGLGKHRKILPPGLYPVEAWPGLTPIKAGEADVAVIAGMGGLTIINIIDESRDIADSFKKLILQPMRHQAKLREFCLV